MLTTDVPTTAGHDAVDRTHVRPTILVAGAQRTRAPNVISRVRDGPMILPLPLRVYEASQALIYTCMTIVLMRPAHFFPVHVAPYAHLHLSSVRTPDDDTGAARHAHIRFMRAHGRPARTNSVPIRPGTRENGHGRGHATHTLHRPAVTHDTTRPLGATTGSLAATTCGRMGEVGRVRARQCAGLSGEQWWAAHTWPQRRCFRTLISSCNRVAEE